MKTRKKNQRVRATFNPAALEYLIIFGEQFPREHNGLFVDKSGRLFLAEASTSGESILRDRVPVPIAKARRSEFKGVSLKDALAWYARCNHWSTESSGSVELLCEMAAKKLEAIESHPCIAYTGPFEQAVVMALTKTVLTMSDCKDPVKWRRVFLSMLNAEFGNLLD